MTVSFHGVLAGTEFCCYLLVEQSPNHSCHHFALARGERSKASMNGFRGGPLLASRAVSIQRLLNRIEEILVAERLRQKLERPCFHGTHAHRDVTVTGNEDNRNCHTGFVQSSLQIKPALSRHPHVEYEATSDIRPLTPQEILSRSKKLDAKPDRPNKVPQRLAHLRI